MYYNIVNNKINDKLITKINNKVIIDVCRRELVYDLRAKYDKSRKRWVVYDGVRPVHLVGESRLLNRGATSFGCVDDLHSLGATF